MDQNTNMLMHKEKRPMGSIISIIVIVLVLALGAYYSLKQVPAGTKADLTPAQIQADPTVSKLSTQGTSTNITDIQKDLNSTDLSGIDSGLNNISL